MRKLGVISGTGLENFPLMADARREEAVTPYGVAVLYHTQQASQELVFLPRHGQDHAVPPHLINYRANISALKQAGVKEVLAFFCVGSLRPDWGPGSLALCDQFIDLTWGRESSFSALGQVIHSDMTAPYCPRLRARLRKAGAQAGLILQTDGVYVCTQGPRLETAAEIRAYRQWGGDLVGMTGVPETPLAREAGLCYAGLSVVANYGAGMTEKVDLAEISRVMERNQENLHQILLAYLALPEEEQKCACGGADKE